MFRGVIPSTVTFFKDDGSLDTEANHRHHDFLISQGVNGLLVMGATGEFMHMNLKEREQHAQETVQHVAKRVPVIIGTGTSSTRETIRLSRHAQGIGADAVAIINPYFWTLSEREIIGHLSSVANAVDIPIFVYNYPAYTGYNVSSETLVKLVREHRNITGVIDSLDSLEHFRQRISIVKGVNPDFCVLAGNDGHLLTILQIGGDGTTPATANFAPLRHVDVYSAYQAGEFERAQQLLPDLLQLLDVYRVSASYLSIIKEAMAIMGVSEPSAPRQPALPLTADGRARLRDILQRSNLLPTAAEP